MSNNHQTPVKPQLCRTGPKFHKCVRTQNNQTNTGAVLRGECQRWASKQACFGVSFDGQAAFPSVDRDIQIRELFSCGESWDILNYSRSDIQV